MALTPFDSFLLASQFVDGTSTMGGLSSRLVRKPIVIGGLVAALLFLVGAAMWHSTRSAPGWYFEALHQDEEIDRGNGRLLERRLVTLLNEIRFAESWSAVLPDQLVNGWLSSDLPEKLPGALPDSIQCPRIKIDGDSIHLVFQSSKSVIQIRLSIQATLTPNQIAFEILSVRSGWLPIPISWWADSLTESLQQQDILLEWGANEGKPVALLTLPHHVTKSDRRLSFLETIQLQGNELAFSGTTEPTKQGEPSPAKERSTKRSSANTPITDQR